MLNYKVTLKGFDDYCTPPKARRLSDLYWDNSQRSLFLAICLSLLTIKSFVFKLEIISTGDLKEMLSS